MFDYSELLLFALLNYKGLLEDWKLKKCLCVLYYQADGTHIGMVILGDNKLEVKSKLTAIILLWYCNVEDDGHTSGFMHLKSRTAVDQLLGQPVRM